MMSKEKTTVQKVINSLADEFADMPEEITINTSHLCRGTYGDCEKHYTEITITQAVWHEVMEAVLCKGRLGLVACDNCGRDITLRFIKKLAKAAFDQKWMQYHYQMKAIGEAYRNGPKNKG